MHVYVVLVTQNHSSLKMRWGWACFLGEVECRNVIDNEDIHTEF